MHDTAKEISCVARVNLMGKKLEIDVLPAVLLGETHALGLPEYKRLHQQLKEVDKFVVNY